MAAIPAAVSTELPTPGRRAVALIALVLMFSGSCGVSVGVSELSTPSTEAPEGKVARSAEEAMGSVQTEVARLVLADSNRRPLAASNIVVSLLLLFAATMLIARRPSALWWTTNAVLANLLWIVVQMVNQAAVILGGRTHLRPLLERWLELSFFERQGVLPPLPDGGVVDAGVVDGGVQVADAATQEAAKSMANASVDALFWTMIVLGLAYGALRIAIFLILLWRVRRPDARSWLSEIG